MRKLILFIFLIQILGCTSDENEINNENKSEAPVSPLADLNSKSKWNNFSLKLQAKHLSTEKIGNEIILNFQVTFINNQKDTLRALVSSCPYDQFELLSTSALEFYPPNYCYTSFPMYLIFPPGLTKFNHQCRLVNSKQSIEGIKLAFKFSFVFGIAGIDPIDMGARVEYPPFEVLSNFISLKDDFKQPRQ